MRIALDMDGVVANFIDEYLRRANHKHKTNMEAGDIFNPDIPHCFRTRTGVRLNFGEFLSSFFFEALDPYPHAVKAIEALQEMGCDVFFLTTTYGMGHAAAKASWAKNVCGVSRVICVHSNDMKRYIDADLIIDDHPDVVKSIGPERAVLMDRPWNRHVGDEFVRIYDLRELLDAEIDASSIR